MDMPQFIHLLTGVCIVSNLGLLGYKVATSIYVQVLYGYIVFIFIE